MADLIKTRTHVYQTSPPTGRRAKISRAMAGRLNRWRPVLEANAERAEILISRRDVNSTTLRPRAHLVRKIAECLPRGRLWQRVPGFAFLPETPVRNQRDQLDFQNYLLLGLRQALRVLHPAFLIPQRCTSRSHKQSPAKRLGINQDGFSNMATPPGFWHFDTGDLVTAVGYAPRRNLVGGYGGIIDGYILSRVMAQDFYKELLEPETREVRAEFLDYLPLAEVRLDGLNYHRRPFLVASNRYVDRIMHGRTRVRALDATEPRRRPVCISNLYLD